jgi:SAM-dependent methyltransferase
VTVTPAAELLREAERTPFLGWDFSWLGDRLVTSPLRWDFAALAQDALRTAEQALDMETGGGEWLSSMNPLPTRMIATEAWAPNLRVASERLGAVGAFVVHDEGAVDNVLQHGSTSRGRLPFRTATFDLVTNRHGAFTATEVARILRPDGVFLTQQADSEPRQFHELLGLTPPAEDRFELDLAVSQVEQAGLRVEAAEDGEEELHFADVGALAWYLKAIPWCIPDFSIDRYREPLLRMHGHDIVVRAARFWVRCRK